MPERKVLHSVRSDNSLLCTSNFHTRFRNIPSRTASLALRLEVIMASRSVVLFSSLSDMCSALRLSNTELGGGVKGFRHLPYLNV